MNKTDELFPSYLYSFFATFLRQRDHFKQCICRRWKSILWPIFKMNLCDNKRFLCRNICNVWSLIFFTDSSICKLVKYRCVLFNNFNASFNEAGKTLHVGSPNCDILEDCLIHSVWCPVVGETFILWQNQPAHEYKHDKQKAGYN